MSGTCIGCGTQMEGGVLCATCWAATTTSAPKTADQINAPQTGRTEFKPYPMFKTDIQDEVHELVKRWQIAADQLTQEQVVKIIKEMIQSGDFIKHVRVDNGAQAMVYIPFAREQEMESRIKELEQCVDELGSKIAAEILDTEGAMISARDAGEWNRYHTLEGHKSGLLWVHHRIQEMLSKSETE